MTLRERIAAEIRERGANAVARDLKMARASVVSFVAGAAREGTVALVEKHDAERRAPAKK